MDLPILSMKLTLLLLLLLTFCSTKSISSAVKQGKDVVMQLAAFNTGILIHLRQSLLLFNTTLTWTCVALVWKKTLKLSTLINVETLKTDMTTLKDDIVALKSEFKDEMAATRASLQAILQALGVNSATPQQVNHTQPYVPTTMSPNPTVLNATMPNTASTPPMTQAQQTAFEEW
ncbi:uncharacterized protein LOC9308440 [Arabidopsis lyrata subsp. lyrata]|uniref:uncharacterized protein LOC9308440 n=1 Tax=Arabidopsis lyrata subsp. lyrata TaxID=81972 RepID=UPI000A29A432|nr:uncharacterized protein LOC9308440 [Arabidopsis lyrata subsp. lyrata]|eukprot:XP_020877519.1 uncharacterized protein LOC9308440 [Arabidopsis lyrata subsp. lyrata]